MKRTFVGFSGIQGESTICGVTYTTVDKIYSDESKCKVTLRKSEMLLQECIFKLKQSFSIPDCQIEELESLIENDSQQKILENNIE